MVDQRKPSGIAWTDETWNPLRGCSKVSEGCRNCYAETVANRFSGSGMPYEGTITNGRWNGEIRLVPEVLDQPLRWKKPRRIFVNSMSDLFHENVSFVFIEKVFDVMEEANWHTFQVLTKRPKRMLEFMTWYLNRNSDESVGYRHDPPKNVWLGVSVENQKAADERIPLLLQTPAAVRFLSMEPLLGSVDLRKIQLGPNGHGLTFQVDSLTGWANGYNENSGNPKIMRNDQFGKVDWVIVGGESGHKARPMHPDWVRSIRDQCVASRVPFLFKQWGEFEPYIDEKKFTHCGEESNKNMHWYVNPDGSNGHCWIVDGEGSWQNWTGDPQEGCHVVNRVGVKVAGRFLDGRLWDEYPEVIS